jgi:hypothetical protein
MVDELLVVLAGRRNFEARLYQLSVQIMGRLRSRFAVTRPGSGVVQGVVNHLASSCESRLMDLLGWGWETYQCNPHLKTAKTPQERQETPKIPSTTHRSCQVPPFQLNSHRCTVGCD